MRILIIGGTAFVGRHIAQAAIDNGHEVTVFHRGKTGADLFPEAQHLTGDRGTKPGSQEGSMAAMGESDLSALATGTWDATVDVSAYFPRQVQELAEVLDGRGGRQLYISTMSVYRSPVAPGFDEDAALAELDNPDTDQVTLETYGALKAACEHAAATLYGADRTTIIRPTYVIGPYDRSYRFTYWVQRIAAGGEVLAPAEPEDPIQVIDARDQGSFCVSLLEREQAGVFHTCGPAKPFGFGGMLEAVASAVAPPGTTLTWVGKDFLLGEGIDGEILPLWTADDPEADINAGNPARAIAAGLQLRPLANSIADLQAAETASPSQPPPGTGISREREAELLASWAAR
jgi:2'-hydroxyisoflavone reductase